MAGANESYWLPGALPERTFPAFVGNLETDIAIVGGGIAGLTAAYLLSRYGLRVALFEQDLIGAGNSGYSTAFVSHFLDSAEDTKHTWSASEQAFETIERIIKEKKIQCDFQRLDAVSFTVKDSSSLEDASRRFLSVDSSIRFLSAEEVAKFCGFNASAAILIKNEAILRPRKYLANLAKIIGSEGGEVFEMSKVLDVQDGGRVLLTAGGKVSAKATIMATGYPLTSFPEITKLISQSITYVVGLRFEKPAPFKDYLFWDDETPYHYFRRINDFEVVLGGEDRSFLFKTVKDIEKIGGPGPFLNLKKYMENLIGQECEIIQKWQGGIFDTLDNLPYIGRHPSYGENIYFAYGFSGNGITLGTLAGEIIADMLVKRDNKFAKQFSFARL